MEIVIRKSWFQLQCTILCLFVAILSLTVDHCNDLFFSNANSIYLSHKKFKNLNLQYFVITVRLLYCWNYLYLTDSNTKLDSFLNYLHVNTKVPKKLILVVIDIHKIVVEIALTTNSNTLFLFKRKLEYKTALKIINKQNKPFLSNIQISKSSRRNNTNRMNFNALRANPEHHKNF